MLALALASCAALVGVADQRGTCPDATVQSVLAGWRAEAAGLESKDAAYAEELRLLVSRGDAYLWRGSSDPLALMELNDDYLALEASRFGRVREMIRYYAPRPRDGAQSLEFACGWRKPLDSNNPAASFSEPP